MRVAVYCGDILETTGGGFTFEQDILRALLQLRAPQRHSFVIYTAEAKPTFEFDESVFQFQQMRSKHWSKFQIWLNTYFEPLPFVLNTLGLRGWFERSLQRQGVEFIWFVSPGHLQV